jgi:hypothetical protein
VYNILKKNHSDFHVSINQLIGIEPGYTGKDDSPDVDASALRKLAQTIAQKKTTYASQPRVKRGY